MKDIHFPGLCILPLNQVRKLYSRKEKSMERNGRDGNSPQDEWESAGDAARGAH